MVDLLARSSIPVWIGIALCTAQAGIFSGLNLAVFSVSRLRLEIEAARGRRDALRVLALRKESNLTLSTILWGNVGANVLLTLLSHSVLTGVGAFIFSTFVITLLGEIAPQAYFSRNAIRIAALFAPAFAVYRFLLFPIAKPTALALDWWLGPESIALFREQDFRELLAKHVEAARTGVGRIEAMGALNFLDLDDIPVLEEGEAIDPLSIISLPMADGQLLLPSFNRSTDDPFLRKLDASGKKWVILVGPSGQPCLALDAHHFLRDALFEERSVDPRAYCHSPIVITKMNERLGDVIDRMKVKAERVGDDVIDQDVILVWGKQKRIITGADLLGRLLRGIASQEVSPNLQ